MGTSRNWPMYGRRFRVVKNGYQLVGSLRATTDGSKGKGWRAAQQDSVQFRKCLDLASERLSVLLSTNDPLRSASTVWDGSLPKCIGELAGSQFKALEIVVAILDRCCDANSNCKQDPKFCCCVEKTLALDEGSLRPAFKELLKWMAASSTTASIMAGNS